MRACSASTTSMMTPPLSISARPRFTSWVPVSACREPFGELISHGHESTGGWGGLTKRDRSARIPSARASARSVSAAARSSTVTAEPGRGISTHVRPGVRRIGSPAAVRRSAGCAASGRLHRPATTAPPVKTSASPSPTLRASGDRLSDADVPYGVKRTTTLAGATWTPPASRVALRPVGAAGRPGSGPTRPGRRPRRSRRRCPGRSRSWRPGPARRPDRCRAPGRRTPGRERPARRGSHCRPAAGGAGRGRAGRRGSADR